MMSDIKKNDGTNDLWKKHFRFTVRYRDILHITSTTKTRTTARINIISPKQEHSGRTGVPIDKKTNSQKIFSTGNTSTLSEGRKYKTCIKELYKLGFSNQNLHTFCFSKEIQNVRHIPNLNFTTHTKP